VTSKQTLQEDWLEEYADQKYRIRRITDDILKFQGKTEHKYNTCSPSYGVFLVRENTGVLAFSSVPVIQGFLISKQTSKQTNGEG